jgi:hypothetical protein
MLVVEESFGVTRDGHAWRDMRDPKFKFPV